MIYLDLFGRLGNNLFQFFAVRSLNPDAEIRLIYHNTRGHRPDLEGLLSSYTNRIQEISLAEVPRNIPRYVSHAKGYTPIPMTDSIYLSGYFQSYKHLDRELVLSHFLLDESTQAALQCKYDLIRPYSFISVRRGDFLEKEISSYFNLCGMDYYTQALDTLSPKGHIAVCSDDIAWCKSVFKGRQFIFIDRSSPLEQLHIMSMADAGICANSTFSWWGAYLMRTPERIIVPDVWVNYEASNQWRAKDFCPPEWTIISNIQ